MPQTRLANCQKCDNVWGLHRGRRTKRIECPRCYSTRIIIMKANALYQSLKEKIIKEVRAEFEEQKQIAAETKKHDKKAAAKERAPGRRPSADPKALDAVYGPLMQRVHQGKISRSIIYNTIDSPAWKHLLKKSKLSISEAVTYMIKKLEAQSIKII